MLLQDSAPDEVGFDSSSAQLADQLAQAIFVGLGGALLALIGSPATALSVLVVVLVILAATGALVSPAPAAYAADRRPTSPAEPVETSSSSVEPVETTPPRLRSGCGPTGGVLSRAHLRWSGAVSPLPDRRAPVIAGRYSPEREIGRGGMGAVWLARDEVLGRQVALKRIGLLPGADSTDLARAEREARLSAQLNHPHVVAVFDVVVDAETDHRWLVMEYVDGITLGQLVRDQGRLSPDEAAPLLLQVADALVAAHAAGIAHRDVKPSNILIDRQRRVKLTDFGIARITSDPSLTQTGMVTGSPSYLAPEIATGRGGDEAADVWSLGATLFHLLAGRPPYDMTDNVLAGLYRMVNEEPPRLAEAGWLAPLLEATMVRDPQQRWSMKQVRDFLADPTRRDAPTRVQPVPEPERAEETTRIPLLTGPGSAFADAPEDGGSADGAPATTDRDRRRRPAPLLLVGLVLLIVLAVGVYAVLANRDAGPSGTAAGPKDPTSSPTPTPTPSPSPSPSPSPTPAAKPTAAAMKAFIRSYVTKVGDDPSQSWQMLTPKFQGESGGFTKYLSFWDAATNGRVLSIDANPADLTVSYQVRFDNFNNGPGPTVLALKFENGKYLIDGESSAGFVPAG